MADGIPSRLIDDKESLRREQLEKQTIGSDETPHPNFSDPSAPQETFQTFKKFPELPGEIRNKIWKIALGFGKMIRMTMHTPRLFINFCFMQLAYAQPSVPPLVHVYVESRGLALPYYQRTFLKEVMPFNSLLICERHGLKIFPEEAITMERRTQQWWNPETDVVFFDEDQRANISLPGSQCRARAFRHFLPYESNIWYLAVTEKHFNSLRRQEEWLFTFRSLRHIFVFVSRNDWRSRRGKVATRWDRGDASSDLRWLEKKRNRCRDLQKAVLIRSREPPVHLEEYCNRFLERRGKTPVSIVEKEEEIFGIIRGLDQKVEEEKFEWSNPFIVEEDDEGP